MSQLPRSWEPKKGSGDSEMKIMSFASKEIPKKKDEPMEEEKEEKPTCCRQVGLAKMPAHKVEEWKAGLLAAQSKLSAKEIRRFRLKYHVVICLELDEDGLHESAAYIRHLLQMNVEMRRAAGPDTLMWQKPKLRDNVEYLNRLREGMTKAERAHQDDRPGEQCAALMDAAIFFMEKDEPWWWVAEQLFLWSVSVSERFKADGGRREAITRYIYGMFLLKQLDDVEAARSELQTARALSAGKDWDASKELGRSQESVFREVCSLLYKALLLAAQQCRDEDPIEAIRLCASSLRRAKDSNHKEHEAEAFYELGISYQLAREDVKALEILTEYLQMCNELKDPQGLCNAHLEIAICFKDLSDPEETLAHLERFLLIADINYLTVRKAEANRFLGEFHLNMGNYVQAEKHFETSFSLYYKMLMMEEMEQLRVLQGMAAGHQLIAAYTTALLNAAKFPPSMRMLLRWKDNHTPFWEASASSINTIDSDRIKDRMPKGSIIVEESNVMADFSDVLSVFSVVTEVPPSVNKPEDTDDNISTYSGVSTLL